MEEMVRFVRLGDGCEILNLYRGGIEECDN